MRIRIAEATGCPVPQFVIEAENLEDRLILKAFCAFPEYSKDEWRFQLHSSVRRSEDDGGYYCFNFGWARADTEKYYKSEKEEET